MPTEGLADMTPSEGVGKWQENATPSEGVMRGKGHNGSESWDSVPLWKGDERAMPFTGAVTRGAAKPGLRNGTESRDLLPLWKQKQERRGNCAPSEGGKRRMETEKLGGNKSKTFITFTD